MGTENQTFQRAGYEEKQNKNALKKIKIQKARDESSSSD